MDMIIKMNRKTRSTLMTVVIFSIAMAFLETAVVVYLRELYFPDGFRFPLTGMNLQIVITELIREFATIVMLIGIGYLAGYNTPTRFGYFLLSFAIWDIFYYVFLYILLGWPVHIFEWDILFLIPILWTGPVITPILISFAMLSMALLMIAFEKSPDKKSILGILSGVVIVLGAFMKEFADFHRNFYHGNFSIKAEDLLQSGSEFIPRQFPWAIFLIGGLFIVAGIMHFVFQIYTFKHKVLMKDTGYFNHIET